MRRIIPALTAIILLSGSVPALAQYHEYDFWDQNYTVQALLGAVKYENLDMNVGVPGQRENSDLSIIPQIGGAWGTLPIGDRIQVGLEASFLFGFRSKDVEYIVINNGLRARISTSLWMIDLAGGGYLNIFLDKGKKVRLYGAAGPMLMYADYDAENDAGDDPLIYDTTWEDQRESAFGYGAYVRAGLEFRIFERGMLGMGIRANYVELDFSDVGGTSDMNGLAGFVSFTAGL